MTWSLDSMMLFCFFCRVQPSLIILCFKTSPVFEVLLVTFKKTCDFQMSKQFICLLLSQRWISFFSFLFCRFYFLSCQSRSLIESKAYQCAVFPISLTNLSRFLLLSSLRFFQQLNMCFILLILKLASSRFMKFMMVFLYLPSLWFFSASIFFML